MSDATLGRAQGFDWIDDASSLFDRCDTCAVKLSQWALPTQGRLVSSIIVRNAELFKEQCTNAKEKRDLPEMYLIINQYANFLLRVCGF